VGGSSTALADSSCAVGSEAAVTRVLLRSSLASSPSVATDVVAGAEDSFLLDHERGPAGSTLLTPVGNALLSPLMPLLTAAPARLAEAGVAPGVGCHGSGLGSY